MQNCILCNLLPNRTSARLHCRPDKHTAHPRHGPRRADTSSVLQLHRCFPSRYSDCEVHHQRQRAILVHSDHRQVEGPIYYDSLRSESVCSDWYVNTSPKTFNLAVPVVYPVSFIRRGIKGIFLYISSYSSGEHFNITCLIFYRLAGLADTSLSSRHCPTPFSSSMRSDPL